MHSSEMAQDTDDLYQIALLIDQLKHDEVQNRAVASKSLISIARALGSERTRDELIPFLTESVDDEDEVITIIAEKLGELSDYVGGNDYVYCLLKPLELLICGEESLVRDKAIKSLEKIIKQMSDDHINSHFLPFLSKLATKDWFTARASAAVLIHLAYSRTHNKKQSKELLSIFLQLCRDETPSVRRAAAQSLVSLMQLMNDASALEEMTAIFKQLASDDQDSIRIQVVPICISLSAQVSLEIKTQQVLPVVLQLAADRSWRVRWALAQRLHEIIHSLKQNSNDAMNSSLTGVLEGLLTDNEPEVRAAAASHLSLIAAELSKHAVLKTVLPSSQQLVTDQSDFVRAFFALEVSRLAPLLGREDTINTLLPMLLMLLRDESSEVRLNVISGLDAVNDTIGVESLSQSLLPAIVQLAQDSKWRVRLVVIDNMPMLGKQLGVEFFNSKLINICVNWLSDDVHAIRKAAAENLKKLTDLFGDEWCRLQIIPQIRELRVHSSFSQRMTALYALQVLLNRGNNSDLAETSVLPDLLEMASDAVPNVRFNVARSLQNNWSCLRGKESIASAARTLHNLKNDSDRDVRFFAEKALKEIFGTTRE